MLPNASVDILSGELQVLDRLPNDIPIASLMERPARIEIIFQGFNLVKRLTVVDNIASGKLHRMRFLDGDDQMLQRATV